LSQDAGTPNLAVSCICSSGSPGWAHLVRCAMIAKRWPGKTLWKAICHERLYALVLVWALVPPAGRSVVPIRAPRILLNTVARTRVMGFILWVVSQGFFYRAFSIPRRTRCSQLYRLVDVRWICRAGAARHLQPGPYQRSKFVPLAAKDRFTARASGEIGWVLRAIQPGTLFLFDTTLGAKASPWVTLMYCRCRASWGHKKGSPFKVDLLWRS